MDDIEFKELFKVAVETLREKTITPLLEADAAYQEDSENEGIAETHYHDLSRVDIAYTTSSDDVHELQISADLLHFRLDTYIDNRLSASKQYQSLEDMVKNCLPHLDFSEMVADAEILAEALEQKEAQAQLPPEKEKTEPPADLRRNYRITDDIWMR